MQDLTGIECVTFGWLAVIVNDEEYTWIVLAVPAPVVSVDPAATSLFQTGTGRSAVTGLPLNLTDTHSIWWRAGYSTAAPKAPFAHYAVIGWTPEEEGKDADCDDTFSF